MSDKEPFEIAGAQHDPEAGDFIRYGYNVHRGRKGSFFVTAAGYHHHIEKGVHGVHHVAAFSNTKDLVEWLTKEHEALAATLEEVPASQAPKSVPDDDLPF